MPVEEITLLDYGSSNKTYNGNIDLHKLLITYRHLKGMIANNKNFKNLYSRSRQETNINIGRIKLDGVQMNKSVSNELPESDDESNAYSSVHEDENVRNRIPHLAPKKTPPLDKYSPPRPISSRQSSGPKANRMFGDSVQHSEDSDASFIAVENVSRKDSNNNRLLNARDVSSSAGRQNLMNNVRKMTKGGSVSSNASSVLSAASAASSNSLAGRRGGSLANIYQARKNSVSYDATTVNHIKAQFQAQIESMMQSQQRNNTPGTNALNSSSNMNSGKPSFRASVGHLQSTSEKELNIMKDLQRGKSFDEARNAVQKQFERILSDNNINGNPTIQNVDDSRISNNDSLSGNLRDRLNTTNDFSNIQHGHMLLHNPVTGAKLNSNGSGMMVKHGMHGVSHAIPGELDDDIRPPPIHYGINQAIKTGNYPMNKNGQNNVSYTDSQFRSNDDLRSNNRFESSASQQNRRLGFSHESLLDNHDNATTSISAVGLPIKSQGPFSASSPRLNPTSILQESPAFKSPSNINISALNNTSGMINRINEDLSDSTTHLSNRPTFAGTGMPLGNIDINVRRTAMSLQSGALSPPSSKTSESKGEIILSC